MGIIFEVIEKNKSDLINILIEILKQAEREGIQIYEKNDDSFCKGE